VLTTSSPAACACSTNSALAVKLQFPRPASTIAPVYPVLLLLVPAS
jgi:hypothetical protein